MFFYNLLDKVIIYVKDERGNLNTLAWALDEPLALQALYISTCFGHDFNKAWWYACNDTKVCVRFWEVNIKST